MGMFPRILARRPAPPSIPITVAKTQTRSITIRRPGINKPEWYQKPETKQLDEKLRELKKEILVYNTDKTTPRGARTVKVAPRLDPPQNPSPKNSLPIYRSLINKESYYKKDLVQKYVGRTRKKNEIEGRLRKTETDYRLRKAVQEQHELGGRAVARKDDEKKVLGDEFADLVDMGESHTDMSYEEQRLAMGDNPFYKGDVNRAGRDEEGDRWWNEDAKAERSIHDVVLIQETSIKPFVPRKPDAFATLMERKAYYTAVEARKKWEKANQDKLAEEESDEVVFTPMFFPTERRQAPPRQQLDNILDELFPESASTRETPTSIPPLEINPHLMGLSHELPDSATDSSGSQKPFLHPDHAPLSPSQQPLLNRLRDNVAVLILSCASRTLAMSDFIRLSPRGEHIEGWTSGLLRVIPGRNPSTLERNNDYFLVFSTQAAATQYLENVKRIHAMSKKYTPSSPMDTGLPTPGEEMGKLGEDVGSLVRGFTLVPPNQSTVALRNMARPFRPAIARVIEKGAYHNVLAQDNDKVGENLVLLHVDQGHMYGRELEKAIAEDGKARNLAWKLEGALEGDVVEFGAGKKGRMAEREDRTLNMGLHPRFIVRFKDAAEARRFVRAWHCRILEREPWDRLGTKGNWAGGKVSTEILW